MAPTGNEPLSVGQGSPPLRLPYHCYRRHLRIKSMFFPLRSHRLLLAASLAILATSLVAGRALAATEATGFLIVNPWLDDSSSGFPLDPPDGVGWTFNSPWEFEDSLISFMGAAMFPTTSSNPVGTHAAEASAIDLTTATDVTSLDGFNPSTTRLTGLTFERPWRVGHYGTVPQSGTYNLSLRFQIDTPGGSYRASTNRLDRATAFQNTIVQLPFNFTWETTGFLGDPFAGGNGIPLAQIVNVDYQLLVEVITPTTGGAGFFNAEGFNVRYDVSSASSSAIAGDFTGNGLVDAGDYTVWRDNLGRPETALAAGSGNGSGTVDQADYNLWVSNFDPAAAASTATAAPEPGTLTGIAIALLAGIAVKRRRVIVRLPGTSVRRAGQARWAWRLRMPSVCVLRPNLLGVHREEDACSLLGNCIGNRGAVRCRPTRTRGDSPHPYYGRMPAAHRRWEADAHHRRRAAQLERLDRRAHRLEPRPREHDATQYGARPDCVGAVRAARRGV